MLGHVARSIGGALPGQSAAPAIRMQSFPLGSGTFTAPVDTFYTFYLRGAAGSGRSQTGGGPVGGAGGSYSRKTEFLTAGTQVPIAVGAGGQPVSGTTNGNPGGDTTAQLPSGTVVAGGGSGGVLSGTATGGVASGGDVNVNGQSVSSPSGGDAGADPVMQPFRSGPGAIGGGTPARSGQDGAGGASSDNGSSAVASGSGGHGALTVIWQQ